VYTEFGHQEVLFAHCDIRPSICETWTLCFADWTVGLLHRQRRYTSDIISVGPLVKLVCLLIVSLDGDGWRRGYSDKSHELSVSVSAESRILLSAWLSVSAETKIPLSVDLYFEPSLFFQFLLCLWRPRNTVKFKYWPNIYCKCSG